MLQGKAVVVRAPAVELAPLTRKWWRAGAAPWS